MTAAGNGDSLSGAGDLPALTWDADQDLAYLSLGSLSGEEVETISCEIDPLNILVVFDVGTTSRRIAGFEIVPASRAFPWMDVLTRASQRDPEPRCTPTVEVDGDWNWADVRIAATEGELRPTVVPFACRRLPGILGCVTATGMGIVGFRIPDPRERLPLDLITSLTRR